MTKTPRKEAGWAHSFGAVLAALGLVGCYSEGSGLMVRQRLTPDGGLPVETPDSGPVLEAGKDGPSTPCTPAQSVEHVTAISAAMSGQVSESSTMFVSDLFNRFKSSCGGCHVEASLGDFHVSPVTFAQDMDRSDVLSLIFSTDPNKVMPPGVGAADTRDPNTDAELRLGALLKAWYAQGRPSDVFIRPQDNNGDAGASHSFLLSQNVGEGLTNIGNCVPAASVVGLVKDDLDAMFEAADKLPNRLEQTDVTTFDSETLAQHGVVAFAPGYPLWSDSARKIRYVRVPKGQSIQFDRDTQKFVIPDNTRFYKTFLRKVIEKDGSEHWHKIETRLIVARQQHPLFGSYQWSDDESEAILDDEPLRNHSVFKDRVITYVTDQAKYDSITAQEKADGAAGGNELRRALIKAGAIRTYAIPGSDRCVQCHMGSPSRSFVLGFTPLQINRRPLGKGGVIDEPGPDELNQLKRFIDYGIVTGITDPSDPTEVLPLENSEGSRPPRNDYELKAQGYMLGNCAHCHNPNGFPSVQNPVLATTLSFLPGPGDNQGIFQFPLEKFSPRITRGLGGAVNMPYITPSLVDYPSQVDLNHTVDHSSPSSSPVPASGMVLAPWRSLLYRAVDTPFPYSIDLALLPHMPINVPGYDCRVTQIMGDWMVSIPAERKHSDIDETLVQASLPAPGGLYDNTGTDQEFQPYKEVLAPDPNKPDPTQQAAYNAAKKAATARLKAYHEAGASGLSTSKNDWSRYNYCPDTSDIVDPTVTGADRAHLVPSDLRVYEADGKTYNVPVDYQPLKVSSGVYDEDLEKVPFSATIKWPDEGVPDRPHWVVTDITDNPPPWVPRRDDWKTILSDKKFTARDDAQERAVVEMLNPSQGGDGVRLSQNVHDYVDHEIPYGLWKPNDTCAAKFANVPKVSDYQGAARPLWMDVAKAASNAPVYAELPGAAVFNMVCVNCHGPKLDSRGRQADTLQLMTGGDARVANFRDGFLGPTTSPGANRKAVYDITPQAGAPTSDDWASRYMAWMALGGTQKLIPRAILNVVATTPIFGIVRNLTGVDSANMLGPVQTLCGEFFGMSSWIQGSDPSWWYTPFESQNAVKPTNPWDNWFWQQVMNGSQGRLMTGNGDAELWAKLCGLNNPMPVAAIRVDGSVRNGNFAVEGYRVNYYSTALYPAGQPIGNDRGSVDTNGFQPTNLIPWCVVRPGDSSVPPEAAQFTDKIFTTADAATQQHLPYCPSDLLSNDQMTWYDLREWSFRGAINAGLAVFVYVDKVSKGYTPIPPYDQCESLP